MEEPNDPNICKYGDVTITYVKSLEDVDFSPYETLEWKEVYRDNVIDFGKARAMIWFRNLHKKHNL